MANSSIASSGSARCGRRRPLHVSRVLGGGVGAEAGDLDVGIATITARHEQTAREQRAAGSEEVCPRVVFITGTMPGGR